jgi:hypothetical protein
MNEKSIYQDIEEAMRRYYGNDTDPLKFVPAVSNSETAHELALLTERLAAGIDYDRIAIEALRSKPKLDPFDPRTSLTLESFMEHSIDQKLQTTVVNIESIHARLDPDDFFGEARQSQAFILGNAERNLLDGEQ